MTTRASVNAPRPEDVGTFWHRMTARGGGPAKPSKFLVQIEKPTFGGSSQGRILDPAAMNRLKDLTFQCESAELPGRTIETSDLQLAGPSQKLPYGSTYADITLTFLCTNDMYERRIFDDWLNFINSRDNATSTYLDDYSTSIGIFQYDEGGDSRPWPAVTYGAILIQAHPIAINQMSLAWNEDSVHRLSVTFAYTQYKPIFALNSPRPLPDLGALTGAYSSVGGIVNQAQSGIANFQQSISQAKGAFNGLATFLGSFFA